MRSTAAPTFLTDAHVSLARYYPEGTIISNGLEQVVRGRWLAPGFVFPRQLDWLVNAMAVVASETFTSTSAPLQYAAVTALQDRPEMDAYLAHTRDILATLASYAQRELRAAGAEPSAADGGFYLFPRLAAQRQRFVDRGIVDGESLTRRLLEDTGVAALPGINFGRPADELSMRIALVDFDGAARLAACNDARPDQAFVREHCGDVSWALSTAWPIGCAVRRVTLRDTGRRPQTCAAGGLMRRWTVQRGGILRCCVCGSITMSPLQNDMQFEHWLAWQALARLRSWQQKRHFAP